VRKSCVVESYSFETDNIAQRYLEDLRNKNLTKNQTKFFLGFWKEAYNSFDEDYTSEESNNLGKWLKGTGSPEMDWERIEEDFGKYISDYIDENSLETQEEKIPEPGYSKKSLYFVPEMNLEKINYEGLEPANMPEDVWITQKVRIGYRASKDFEEIGQAVVYHDRDSAKRYFENLCNEENHNMETAELIVRAAISENNIDMALELTDIMLEYNPERVERIIEEDLRHDERFLEEFFDLVENSQSKGQEIADYLNENTDEEF